MTPGTNMSKDESMKYNQQRIVILDSEAMQYVRHETSNSQQDPKVRIITE